MSKVVKIILIIVIFLLAALIIMIIQGMRGSDINSQGIAGGVNLIIVIVLLTIIKKIWKYNPKNK